MEAQIPHVFVFNGLVNNEVETDGHRKTFNAKPIDLGPFLNQTVGASKYIVRVKDFSYTLKVAKDRDETEGLSVSVVAHLDNVYSTNQHIHGEWFSTYGDNAYAIPRGRSVLCSIVSGTTNVYETSYVVNTTTYWKNQLIVSGQRSAPSCSDLLINRADFDNCGLKLAPKITTYTHGNTFAFDSSSLAISLIIEIEPVY
jgi:hypothetical protein